MDLSAKLQLTGSYAPRCIHHAHILTAPKKLYLDTVGYAVNHQGKSCHPNNMPVYDPHNRALAEQEASRISVNYPGINQDMFSQNVSATTSKLSKVSAWHSPMDAMEKLNDNEGYIMTDVMRLACSVTTRERRRAVTAEQFAQ